MVKRTWGFYIRPEATVTCDVQVTGDEEKTITVSLRNRSEVPVEDPLTVEVLENDVVTETLEDKATVAIAALATENKEYNYTPTSNGWKIRVTYGED